MRKRSLAAAPVAIALLAGCVPDDLLGSHTTSSGAGGTPLPPPDPTIVVPPPHPNSAPLGATVEKGGVTFRVWAPGATSALVSGSFAGGQAEMTLATGGIWAVHVDGAKAGDTYHFTFGTANGTVDRLDPRSRELAGTDCRVIDPSTYAWQSAPFQRPKREQAVVYELHVGSYAVDAGAPQGTFASLQGKLGDLADLGANVIELMPAFDSGSGIGWGYSPQLYDAPRPSYGSADELRALVDEAHLQGIGVWLDVVYNHYDGSTKAPLRCFDGDCADSPAGVYFFPKSSPWATTPWGPRPDFSKLEVADMIVESLSTWMVEMRGDGFRWDSVSNIRGNDGQGTAPGSRELIVRGNALIHELGGTSVAEDLKGLSAITQDPSAGGFGFDAQWDGFGYTVSDQLAMSDDNARDLGKIKDALTGSYGGDPFARLIWIEDHDTVGNGGSHLPSRIDAANPESFAARKRSMLGGVLLLTAPGVPMLFQGQDILASGTFTSQPAPLAAPTSAGLLMRGFYKDLIELRRNAGGNTGSLADPGITILHRNDSAKVMAYHRHGASGDDVIVIVNLRNKAYATYDIGVPSAGPWQVRLDTDWTTYGADFGGGQTGAVQTSATAYDGQPYKLPIKLGAYSAVVFSR